MNLISAIDKPDKGYIRVLDKIINNEISNKDIASIG